MKYAQTVSLAIINMIVSFLSFVCSSKIVHTIFVEHKQKTRPMKTYERLMLGISASDMLFSAAIFPGAIVAPKSTEALWAIGNNFTCAVQGFLNVLANLGLLYNASLCIYFLLFIRYNVGEEAMHKYERWFHIVPVTIAVCLSLYGLYLKIYNFAGNRCWIAAHPFGCDSIEGMACERAGNVYLLRWLFAGVWLILIMIVMIICMFFIYSEVHKTETRTLRYNFNYNLRQKATTERDERDIATKSGFLRSSANKVRCYLFGKNDEEEKKARKKSTRIKTLALLYCGGFFLSFVWSFIARFTEKLSGDVPFVLFLAVTFFNPSQGIWNYMIFLYRRRTTRKRSSLVRSKRLMRSSDKDEQVVKEEQIANI